jgi:hypothetical protein
VHGEEADGGMTSELLIEETGAPIIELVEDPCIAEIVEDPCIAEVVEDPCIDEHLKAGEDISDTRQYPISVPGGPPENVGSVALFLRFANMPFGPVPCVAVQS